MIYISLSKLKEKENTFTKYYFHYVLVKQLANWLKTEPCLDDPFILI